MSDRKNHNSLIFLTTLGVYLGLVLVGSSPAVLAQAATTRTFDIKSEIVVEDDLDKKPDDLTGSEVEFVEKLRLTEAILDFVADLKRLESDGGADRNKWNAWQKVVVKGLESPQQTIKLTGVDRDPIEPAFDRLIATAVPGWWGATCSLAANTDTSRSEFASAEVSLTSNEFSLSFVFNKKSAQQARVGAREFNRIFVERKVALDDNSLLPIYDGTNATAENNQVLIVTRLPRASIDELLAH